MAGSEVLSALVIKGQLERIAEDYERMHAEKQHLVQEIERLRTSTELVGRQRSASKEKSLKRQRSGTSDTKQDLSPECREQRRHSERSESDDNKLPAGIDCTQKWQDEPFPDLDHCLSEHAPLSIVDLDTRQPLHREDSGGKIMPSMKPVIRSTDIDMVVVQDVLSSPYWSSERSVDASDEEPGGLALPKITSESAANSSSPWISEDDLVGEGGFPRWFDPGDRVQNELHPSSVWEDSFTKKDLVAAAPQGQESHSYCILAPVCKKRLAWDSFAFFALLIEFWMTPFDLIYLETSGTPGLLEAASHVITIFFTIDLILNFNTGFIYGDRTVMHRPSIIKNYVKFWFWVDLTATVPFDLLAETFSGSMLSMTRVGKASKVLKTLRYLKMIRAFRLVRTMHQAGNVTRHLQILDTLRYLIKPLQVLTFLLLFAHVHGCIFTLIQPDREDAETFEEALKVYFQSLGWAFLAVTVGAFGDIDGERPLAFLLLGMIIASERLFFIIFGSHKVIFNTLCFADDAREVYAQRQVVKFLRDHKVSFQTQLQVLFNMTDTTEAQKHQKVFLDFLWNDDMPQSLRREINHELWSERLSSLGLIAKVATWHEEFVIELAQHATEKVVPSRVVVYTVGEPALEAYHIIQGELKVMDFRGSNNIPIPYFTKGMWVGESALASSSLRYSATLMSRISTSMMVIQGKDFFQLVSYFALMTTFEEFCSAHLWKGLCGRCGSLGSHFSDTCCETKGALYLFRAASAATTVPDAPPLSQLPAEADAFDPMMSSDFSGGQNLQKVEESTEAVSGEFRPTNKTVHNASVVGRRHSEESQESEHSPKTPSTGADLRRLLKEAGLSRILPSLKQMGVHDLDGLEAQNGEMVKVNLAIYGHELTEEEQTALTPNYIQEFKRVNTDRVHAKLFQRVSRLHHLIFLSHYKVEAGTEAALMRNELELAIAANPGSLGHSFDEPIFLDSDNLQNLEDLVQRVRSTHNLVLLLTQNVLSRPWVLVEMVTAQREGVRLVPVIVSKPGINFEFPDDAFYSRLRDGSLLCEEDVEVLNKAGCSIDDVEEVIRMAFQQIAVPYSPHKASGIRRAEIRALLRTCKLKEDRSKAFYQDWSSETDLAGMSQQSGHFKMPPDYAGSSSLGRPYGSYGTSSTTSGRHYKRTSSNGEVKAIRGSAFSTSFSANSRTSARLFPAL